MLLSRSNKFDTTIFLTVSWGIAGWVRRRKEEVLIEVKRETVDSYSFIRCHSNSFQ